MTRRQIATRNVLRHVAGGTGLLLVGFGTFLVASYVVGAVQVIGEADRSWLFWGLALASQGLAIGGLGGLLVAWGHMEGKTLTLDATPGVGSPNDAAISA